MRLNNLLLATKTCLLRKNIVTRSISTKSFNKGNEKPNHTTIEWEDGHHRS